MSKTPKKASVRRVLELVKSRITSFPEGEPDPLVQEVPDFVFRCQSNDVGIELGRIHIESADPNSSMRQLEGERQLIVNRAKARCEEAGVPAADVRVHFDGSMIGKKDRGRLAKQISNCVAALDPVQSQHVVLEYDTSGVQLPEEIDRIRITRLPGLVRHFWVPGNLVGFIQEDFEAELQRVIDAKNGRINEYLNNCHRCWLIVYAEWTGPSSFFLFSERMKSHEFVSAFDRVFFADPNGGIVHELKLKQFRPANS
jgi:hypothetical protein